MTWEELTELLAEYEIRLSCLENSSPYHLAKPLENSVEKPERLSITDLKMIKEMKAEVLHYRKEIAELQAKVDKLMAQKQPF